MGLGSRVAGAQRTGFGVQVSLGDKALGLASVIVGVFNSWGSLFGDSYNEDYTVFACI